MTDYETVMGRAGRSITWRLFRWVATIALLIACFLAWQDEHTLRIAAEKTVGDNLQKKH